MQQRSRDTVLSLANANALATGIVHQISGTQVANTLNGAKASRVLLANLIASRIHANFAQHTSKAIAK